MNYIYILNNDKIYSFKVFKDNDRRSNTTKLKTYDPADIAKEIDFGTISAVYMEITNLIMTAYYKEK